MSCVGPEPYDQPWRGTYIYVCMYVSSCIRGTKKETPVQIFFLVFPLAIVVGFKLHGNVLPLSLRNQTTRKGLHLRGAGFPVLVFSEDSLQPVFCFPVDFLIPECARLFIFVSHSRHPVWECSGLLSWMCSTSQSRDFPRSESEKGGNKILYGSGWLVQLSVLRVGTCQMSVFILALPPCSPSWPVWQKHFPERVLLFSVFHGRSESDWCLSGFLFLFLKFSLSQPFWQW